MAFKTENAKLETTYFAALLICLGLISFCKDAAILCTIAIVCFLISGKKRYKIAKSALLAVGLFSSVVVISYAVVAIYQGKPYIQYVASTLTRAYLMSFLTFWFIYTRNLYLALSFSKDLSLLFILSMSKILRLKKLYFEFKEALISRGAIRLEYKFLGSCVALFLHKAMQDSNESAQAMISRGYSV